MVGVLGMSSHRCAMRRDIWTCQVHGPRSGRDQSVGTSLLMGCRMPRLRWLWHVREPHRRLVENHRHHAHWWSGRRCDVWHDCGRSDGTQRICRRRVWKRACPLCAANCATAQAQGRFGGGARGRWICTQHEQALGVSRRVVRVRQRSVPLNHVAVHIAKWCFRAVHTEAHVACPYCDGVVAF